MPESGRLWKFSYAKNYASAIPGFEKEDYDCTLWDEIHVPAHIQMEGYDLPQYANTQYPWDGREDVLPGEIPQRFNPVASYVKILSFRRPCRTSPCGWSLRAWRAAWPSGSTAAMGLHRGQLLSP